MKYKIKPFPKKRKLRFQKENKKIKKKRPFSHSKRQQYTLSYRLQGLTFGLAFAAIYSHFYLGYWSHYVLIITPLFGYFLGYLAGNFLYTKK